MRCRLTVLHTDDGESYYDLGDAQEFRGWRIAPRGLVVRRHDDTRVEVPAAAIRFIDVRPNQQTKKHQKIREFEQRWRTSKIACDRCGQGLETHWSTSDGYPVCPSLVRPDARGEPEWDIETVLDELKTLMINPTPGERDRIRRRAMRYARRANG